jgi:serine/threonine protein kinase/tetratricopeptide (TPR) repeat protein
MTAPLEDARDPLMPTDPEGTQYNRPTASPPDAERTNYTPEAADPERTSYTAPRPGSKRAPLPRRFGDYELLEEIARGGMGVVYKARHLKLDRSVALKMILTGDFASPEAVERFLREARAAAALEHPSIVPIYETGEAEGRPYFTMPLVQGGSLQQRLAAGPLPPAQAARLAQQVTEAVQYAHDRGLIHRDLKPHNILLQTDGSAASSNSGGSTPRPDSGAAMPSGGMTPRLTDFGLARAVNQEGGLTAPGEALGTPSYMPPEQAAGEQKRVGPSADIYSLGAVLYALLVGRPPFQAPTSWETLRQVREQEPVPPRQLNGVVPVDLETVCLKCLEKEPGRRYATARELADDLGRFLAGQPVRARPVGVAERGWRWCLRNPVVAGLSAALVLVLLGGLVGVTLLWRSADEQRKAAVAAQVRAQRLADVADEQRVVAEAETERAQVAAANARREANNANQTARFLTDLFEAADPLGIQSIPALKLRVAETLTAREILDRGAERINRDLSLAPETQAKLLDTIGGVYCTLGLTDEARPLLEKALALRRQQVTSKDPADIATTLHNLGWLHHQAGDYPVAQRYYQEALAIRQGRATTDPLPLSTTMLTLAWLFTDLEEYPSAAELFKGAIELRVRACGPDHRDTAVARASLAAMHLAKGNVGEAVPPYRQAMAALHKVEGNSGLIQSIDLFQRGVIARGLPPLLRWTVELKDDQAVEDCLERSLTLARQALGDQHVYVALVLHELAFTLMKNHKDEAAERYFRDCLRIVKLTSLGLAHPKATFLLINYCHLLARRGKRAEAEQLLKDALEARQHRYPANHYLIADVIFIQGLLQGNSGASPYGQRLLRDALAIYCQSPGAPGRFVTHCVDRLADTLTATETCDLACELARAAARHAEHSNARIGYQDLALSALQGARKKGFKDAERLQRDKDLSELRERKDFQRFVAELQRPSGR